MVIDSIVSLILYIHYLKFYCTFGRQPDQESWMVRSLVVKVLSPEQHWQYHLPWENECKLSGPTPDLLALETLGVGPRKLY